VGKGNNNEVFDGLSKWFMGLAIALILFACFAPYLFTQKSIGNIDFSKTGDIGNTIGGIMSPLIAIAGIFITFIAFYIQVIANKRLKDEFKKSQIESQFYQMLKVHGENVNEINITFVENIGGNNKYQNLKGRATFQYFMNELNILYQIEKTIAENENPDLWIQKAYHIFYYGIESEKEKDESGYWMKIQKATNTNAIFKFNNLLSELKIEGEFFPYEFFKGHFKYLDYYRYLHQTVEFIVTQKNISYDEKRSYLQLLRAQLSTTEQEMLFYYWKSGLGNNWENGNNKFFTDYRMIYNINNSLLIKDFNLTEIFKNTNYQKLQDDDTLFDFQHINKPIKY